jgi:hypothetical protein
MEKVTLIGCTDAKTYASLCSICSYAPKNNDCDNCDSVKLYELPPGENTEGYTLIGCCDEKQFFMCKICFCKPEGIDCKRIQGKKVYIKK